MKNQLFARLAAERAGLWWQLVGLDAHTLTQTPVFDDWTAQDILIHVAAWDRWGCQEVQRQINGETPDISTTKNIDEFNAAALAAWQERSLDDVIAELVDSWTTRTTWLQGLSAEKLFANRDYQGKTLNFAGMLEAYWQHDAEHAAQIQAWRQAQNLQGGSGPKALLQAALTAAHADLLASAALIPTSERSTRPLCGEWTLKDVLGHVADWEQAAVQNLRHMLAGRPLQVEHIESIDDWNQEHAQARQAQNWDKVWSDFVSSQQTLQQTLAGTSQESLEQPYVYRWDPQGSPYRWMCIFVHHSREHAQDLRA